MQTSWRKIPGQENSALLEIWMTRLRLMFEETNYQLELFLLQKDLNCQLPSITWVIVVGTNAESYCNYEDIIRLERSS